MNVAPDTSYEAVLETGVTGLVGTIELGLLDNQGAITEALSSADIIETPAGSGIYAATRTSPSTAGQYTLLWSIDGTTDPDQVATDELLVGYSAVSPGPSGPFYATRATLASKLKINATTNATDLDRVLAAATREIDHEIGGPLDSPTAQDLALLETVCLARAQDLWLVEGMPIGVIGLGGETPLLSPRDSWVRHANTLAPLKQSWGIA